MGEDEIDNMFMVILKEYGIECTKHNLSIFYNTLSNHIDIDVKTVMEILDNRIKDLEMNKYIEDMCKKGEK